MSLLPPEEERFYINVENICQIVYSGISKLERSGHKTVDLTLVSIGIAMIKSYNKHSLIQRFIDKTHFKCWESIRNRDENFFINNAGDIFSSLPVESVNIFRDLFSVKDKNGNSVISQGLKDDLWKNFEANIKISIKYIYYGRSKQASETPDFFTQQYGPTFYQDVDLETHIKNFKPKL